MLNVRPAANAAAVADRLRARNAPARAFFAGEAGRIAEASRAVAERLLRGGQLYAFGRGPYATDAAHLSVEFVHPVLVGKRALPAYDMSLAPAAALEAMVGADDVAIGLGPPGSDPAVTAALRALRRRGTLTMALPGTAGDADYAFPGPVDDVHVHQEIFELLGHTLYESVHVFLEHRELGGNDVGAAAFLYPYLGTARQDTAGLIAGVTESIQAKAADAERLREQLAARQAEAIAQAAVSIRARLAAGGRLLLFGNGGSATDATDFMLDCLEPRAGMPPVAAISLALEPAILSALGNDVGVEVTFLRQLIARARPSDVAFAFSTSGGSKNVVAALEEARRRGLLTVALLGYDGGEIVRRALADHAIVIDADYVPRIQEAQAAVYHVLRELLDA